MCNFKIKESLSYKTLPACTFTASTSNLSERFFLSSSNKLTWYSTWAKKKQLTTWKWKIQQAFITQDKISHSAQLKEHKLTTQIRHHNTFLPVKNGSSKSKLRLRYLAVCWQSYQGHWCIIHSLDNIPSSILV